MFLFWNSILSQLTVNGLYFMEYRHHIPFVKVDTISVGGKVQISNIAFQSAMVRCYKNLCRKL